MYNENLQNIAKKIMSGNRGILASDERPSSANKNLTKAGIEPSDENRRKYRELFINTPELEKYINGIILHEETLWQKDSRGKDFKKTLLEKGIEIIIKVDDGTKELPGSSLEVLTLGLDDLPDRLPNYHEAGAKLAKWRSVIRIGENIPTEECINKNAEDITVYALECQKNSMVPIVEPEVLLDGKHSIQKAEEVTTWTIKTVFSRLREKDVDLKATILKTSMVLSGKDSTEQAVPEEIAEATVRTLKNSVPDEVGGIVFLSGGQEPIEATLNLNEIAKKEPLPWELSFSYLRAIEGPPTLVWQGKDENIEAARKEFIKRLKLNVSANVGDYRPEHEA